MASVSYVDFDVLTLSHFQTWSDDALRSYLSLRSKSITGSSSELAARAFVCFEEKIPVNESQEHRLRVNLHEYKNKLMVGNTVIPDPFGLNDGWLEETDSSRSSVPSVSYWYRCNSQVL